MGQDGTRAPHLISTRGDVCGCLGPLLELLLSLLLYLPAACQSLLLLERHRPIRLQLNELPQ